MSASAPAVVPLAGMSDLVPDHFNELSLLGALAGLALLFGGVELMSTGLRRLSGGQLRRALEELGRRRFAGLGIGAIITALVNSSGTTTTILISLVEARVMALAAAVPVILGASIGTAITSQLLAFKLVWMIPVLLVAGVLLRGLSHRIWHRAAGRALYGAGLLFLGLLVLTSALAPLRELPQMREWIGQLESVPVGILAGLLVCLLFQSSTPALGLLMGLSQDGLVTLAGAIPFLMGIKLGSCSTGVIASLQARPTARRVAAVHVLFNLAEIGLFLFWIPWFAHLVAGIPPGGEENIPRSIAHANTVMSVVGALVMLPFTGWLARAASAVVPETPGGKGPTVKLDRTLLEGQIAAPSAALAVARRGVLEMGAWVRDFVARLMRPPQDVADVSMAPRRELEDVHAWRGELTSFLNDISQAGQGRREADESLELVLVTTELDAIAVLCAEALDLAEDQAGAGPFSQAGRRDLDQYFQRALSFLDGALEAFRTQDIALAQRVRREKKGFGQEAAELRRSHVLRMREGIEESERTDALHLAWLELLRQTGTHAARIARIQLDRKGVQDPLRA